MPITRKRSVLETFLDRLQALDDLCAQYQGRTGTQDNRTLFNWMDRFDVAFTKARAEYDALAAVFNNPQIGALLEDATDATGISVGGTLGTIQTAVFAAQDTFAAQLGAGIDPAERTRVSRAWVNTTNDDAARAAITTAVASLRTALAPLVK